MATPEKTLAEKLETADVLIGNFGSVVMITPLTDAGWEWAEAHLVFEDWQLYGGGIVCEPRYVDDVVEGMREAGLVVEPE